MPLRDLLPRGSMKRRSTRRLRLSGARRASGRGDRASTDAPPDAHLTRRYGSQADEVRALVAFDASLGDPLVVGLPYLRAEAVYAVRHEMATTLDDVLAAANPRPSARPFAPRSPRRPTSRR